MSADDGRSGADGRGGEDSPRPSGGLIHGVDLGVALVLLAFCAWVYYETTGFEEVSALFAQDVPPEMVPRLLVWGIVIMSLVLPFEHLLKPGGRAHFDKARSKSIRPMAYATAALLIAIVASVKWAGTYVAIILACVALPVLWGERRWKVILPFALIFPSLVMVLFSYVLKVYFEPGFIGIDLR